MNRFQKLILLLFFTIVDHKCDHSSGTDNTFLWLNISNSATNWAKDYSARNKPIVEEVLNNSEDVSESCRKSLMLTIDGISRLEDWAIEMINSCARFPPSGLFTGTLTDFGSYDQCLQITDNEIIGSPQYCSVSLDPPLPRPMPKQHNVFHQIPNLLPNDIYRNKSNALIKIANESSTFYWLSIRTAICVPNKCSEADIKSMATTVSSNLGLLLKSVRCETKPNKSIDKIQFLAIVFLIMAIILCITATFLDAINYSEKSIFVRIFSSRQTINRLLADTSSKDLTCIHGIRVLTIVWIVYGHSISWINFQLYDGSFNGKYLLANFLTQPFLGGVYGINTFFLISGILTTYITLSMTKSDPKNFNLLLFIAVRFLRLWPQLMIFVLLTFLLPLIGSGPLWSEVIGTTVNNCYNNWWLNSLLVHNLINPEQMCALHTWFIALDYQYHIISTIVILAFLFSYKCGVIVNIFMIMIYVIIEFTVYYIHELPPALIYTGRSEYVETYFGHGFIKTPLKYGMTFFIGTLVGSLLLKRKVSKLSRSRAFFVWTLILVTICVPLWDKVYWNTGRPYTPLIGTLIFNSNHILWNLCVCSAIFMCISGNGSFINRFLSHRVFVPFARLTYSVYLCHAWIIWSFVGSRRHLLDINVYGFITNFLQIIIMSFVVAFAFFILFESPILESQKYLVKHWREGSLPSRDQRVNEAKIRLNIRNDNK